jgi:hypothetical protein
LTHCRITAAWSGGLGVKNMSKQEIIHAIEWLSECEWANMVPEDFEQLSDIQIIKAINRYWTGGVEDFKHMVNFTGPYAS